MKNIHMRAQTMLTSEWVPFYRAAAAAEPGARSQGDRPLAAGPAAADTPEAFHASRPLGSRRRRRRRRRLSSLAGIAGRHHKQLGCIVSLGASQNASAADVIRRGRPAAFERAVFIV
jgi:hypothetical protein